jgi:hypothetical protein
MITYRAVATAAAACLTGVSLAACSAGLIGGSTPASSSASSPAATSADSQAASSTSAPPTSTSSAPTGSGGTGSGNTVSVGGSIGNFPIPPGAMGVVSATNGGMVDVVLSGVDPSTLDSFYTTALPQAGYTITSNTTGSALGISGAEVQFTGHGYKGDIGDANGTIGITFTPQ